MFNIPPVRQYRLLKPPLAQALAQVRFPTVAKASRTDGIAGLQELLRPIFPIMEHFTEDSLSLDLGTDAITKDQSINWHFTDSDGRLLVVNTTSITLSIGKQYEGVRSFIDLFAECLSIVAKEFSLIRCDRVAVRFLDIISEAGGLNWNDLFKEEILGWPSGEVLNRETTLGSSLMQTQLTHPATDEFAMFPSQINAVIRHGVAGAGSVVPGIPPMLLNSRSFIFDLDFYVSGQQKLDIDEVRTQLKGLHSQMDRFFRWSMTAVGEKEFQLEEL